MHPMDKHVNVEYRRAVLARDAAAERLAAARRRQHRDEHGRHPTLAHAHHTAGVRIAVGRLLIGLGSAIAGSGRDAQARRVA